MRHIRTVDIVEEIGQTSKSLFSLIRRLVRHSNPYYPSKYLELPGIERQHSQIDIYIDYYY